MASHAARITIDSTPMLRALAELQAIGARRPAVLNRFCNAFESLTELVSLVPASGPKAACSGVHARLEPSPRLREFLGAEKAAANPGRVQ